MLPDLTASFNWLRAALRRAPIRPTVALPDHACPLVAPDAPLPAWVAADPLVQKYRALLGDLPWDQFPERPTDQPWPGPDPHPRAPFVAAYLIKLHEGKRSMGALRTYLCEHPALVAWLGFPRVPDPTAPHGFHVATTVPTRRQFSRVLRTLSNPALAFLLTATVQQLRATLPLDQQAAFGDVIAGDTQAILAWVAENNPKQFIRDGRLDKTRQPAGDPDCKLGVKKRRNATPSDPDHDHPAPTTHAKPASQLQVGVDILWGYASGIVATRLPNGTEVVLAERTRPFNESDPSYFHPLMAQVATRLGRRPRFGTWDAAYDAHYVYDYFDQAGGFAAVPFNPGGPQRAKRQFAAGGAPQCVAGLPMTLQFTYQHRTGLIPHVREKFRCPLLHPTVTGDPCPIADVHFANGGCTTTIAAGRGSRIRHELDRDGAAYQALYAQRTMVERINSQAEALGILHPRLRRGRAIVNQNTLTYVLINLRALQRIRTTQEAPSTTDRLTPTA
jgi:Transposase DDE domain